jgi:uncharacterized protein (TIGR02453 family)
MITKKYTQFFQELDQNNNKDWFHANKKTYEEQVKKPFINLLETLIPKVESLDPSISMNPKDALFRINKDIRFSKDKSPYHTLMKAGFSPGGKRSTLPGFYLGIGADTVHVGGGLFNVETAQLKQIRNAISNHTEEFISILNLPQFKSTFGGILGEQAKRLDKSFQKTQEKTPYIANKQFYTMTKLSIQQVLNNDQADDLIFAHFQTIQPLNEFLKKALQLP